MTHLNLSEQGHHAQMRIVDHGAVAKLLELSKYPSIHANLFNFVGAGLRSFKVEISENGEIRRVFRSSHFGNP